MTIRLELPRLTELRPRITVIGVGGAGGNAVNNMIASGLTGVEFIVANTDAQALAASSAELRIQLGANLTEGLGAGSKPEIGQAAAEEANDEIRGQIAGSHMVFIAAGMGGGTGTGAASVIARIARELGILVVAIVTKPFQFEGARRMRMAEAGIADLKRSVDTMIVIPNQNLFRVATERTTFAEAFVMADQVLYSGIACIVDLIVKEGLINLDFADVRTVLSGMGSAVMGTGEASGERRAVLAAEEAISNPLLDEISLRGARGLLLSIIGGRNLTLYEVDEAASRVRMEVDPEANIIVGATFDDSLEDRVRVSIVASGMDHQFIAENRHVGGFAQSPQPRVAIPTAEPARQWPEPMPVASAAPVSNQQLNSQSTHSALPGHQPTAIPIEPNGSTGHPSAPPRPSHPNEAARLPASAQVQSSAPPLSPAPPPAPAVPTQSQRDADDYARAMNEAYPQAGQDASVGPLPGVGRHEPKAKAAVGRGSWESPDGVIIEDQPAPTGAMMPPPLPRPSRVDPILPEPGFTPQAPADVRRPPRRMPELNDFPEIAQRDYRAKTPAQDGADRDAVPATRGSTGDQSARRKQGLFERISSFGRRESDDDLTPASYPQAAATPPDVRRGAPSKPARANPTTTPQKGSVDREQGADFPGFFDKKRR